jgi:hypothetical protein
MTRINLLPPEIKGKAGKPNIIPVAIISLITVIVLLVLLPQPGLRQAERPEERASQTAGAPEAGRRTIEEL